MMFLTPCRLVIWYSIISVFFRCPASIDLVTESSPKICKPYFQVKSQVAPHLTPYYDAYAASYVDAARPYYDVLEKRLITPATAYGTKYGAPRLAQVQAFSQVHWEKSIQPQVSKFNDIANQQYSQNLAPYVNKVVNLTGPYYAVSKDSALQTFYGSILPTYSAIQPYAQHGYGVINKFAVDTGIPYAEWAWTNGIIFLNRTVWPKVRILYGENVEPQLVRIGERLGRYRDGKKLQVAVDEIEL